MDEDQILDFEVSTNVPPPNTPADPDATQPPVSAPAEEGAPSDQQGQEETPAEPPRDQHGKFRRRHRARSQEAGPEDVPRIQALTTKNRELQEQLDKLTKPAAEKPVAAPSTSTAAGAAPQQQATPAQQPVPVQAPQPQQQQQPRGLPQAFPGLEAWLALDGNQGKTYDDYIDARSDWRWLINDQTRRQWDDQQAKLRTRQGRIEAYEKSKVDARTKYADFDAVLDKAPQVSAVMVEAMLASDRPSEIAYYLATHPDITQQLSRDTLNYNPLDYGVTQRLLESFVPVAAEQRSSTAQSAADKKTGSALALVPQPAAPKPPNPVRTQAPVPADTDMPGDDSSLDAHEKYFHRGSGRRR